ncbi:MAG: sigma-70 family RNA polymerase sigma factor [Thermoanaerobaculia bacterium]|nr:sigma-70 family RNA polymerase sigma factor [Thermoanaerobaculia bacterium]
MTTAIAQQLPWPGGLVPRPEARPARPARRGRAGEAAAARGKMAAFAARPAAVSTLSDSALLAQIAAGDRAAFQELYERYGGKVLSYVRMLGRDGGASEDVVQEVFLAVWRKAASYRPERGDVPGWLYTITRNKLVDLWRRRDPAESGEEEFDFARMPEPSRGLGSELRLSVHQALAELKEDQRRAVEMAYFGGLTYEETARRLDLPLGTLKSRIRTALMTMRARLQERGEATSEASHA